MYNTLQDLQVKLTLTQGVVHPKVTRKKQDSGQKDKHAENIGYLETDSREYVITDQNYAVSSLDSL